MKELKTEILSVARGTHRAPHDAGQASFESIEAVVRLLTPENRHLLSMIDEKRPSSVAELARLVGRAEPNVSRTLSKLVESGFVRLQPGSGKAKVPEVIIRHLTIDMDVCRHKDHVIVA